MSRGRRSKARFGTIGSVSSGTMRPEDLIPAFLDVADGIRLSKADRQRIREARAEWEGCSAFNRDEDDEDSRPGCGVHEDGDDCEEQIGYLLNETLFDLLGNYAPPYCYFGANEGDGADYGFWPSMEALNEATYEGEVLRVTNGPSATFYLCGGHESETELSRVRDKVWRYRMVVSDHGNVTLYYRNGREVWVIV